MGSIEVGQRCAGFEKVTRICGNCHFEKRERDERRDRTDRSCSKHGWFVLMSSTCRDHQYKQKGGWNAVAKSGS